MYVHGRQFSSTKQFLFVIGTTLHTTQGIIAIICILLKRNVSSYFSKPLDKRYLLTKKQIQRTWNIDQKASAYVYKGGGEGDPFLSRKSLGDF